MYAFFVMPTSLTIGSVWPGSDVRIVWGKGEQMFDSQ